MRGFFRGAVLHILCSNWKMANKNALSFERAGCLSPFMQFIHAIIHPTRGFGLSDRSVEPSRRAGRGLLFGLECEFIFSGFN